MLPIVPNLYDALPGVRPSPASSNIEPQDDHLGTSTSTMKTPVIKLYIPSNTRFDYHPFTQNVRSGRRDFIHSVQEPRSVESCLRSANKNMYTTNPFEEPADHFSFMSSVVVVPKTSGRGYEVYQTPVSTRRENSITDYLDSAGTSGNVFPSIKTSNEFSQRDNVLKPRRSIQSQVIATKGTKFSRNIGNPVMQKKVQDKLQEAKNRADMFRSTRLVGGDYDSFDINDGSCVSRSKPPSPASVRTPIARPPSFPPLTDTNSSFRERYLQSPVETPSRPFSVSPSSPVETPSRPTSVSPSLPSNTNQASVKTTTTSASQLEITGDSPTFRTDDVSSFHESLLVDFRKEHWADSATASNLVTSEPDRLKHQNELLTRSVGDRKLEQNSASLRNLFSNLRRKLLVKKRNFSTTEKEVSARVNYSKGGSVSSEHALECTCKKYHCHSFSGEIVNNDLKARKEKRQGIIMNSMSLQEDHRTENLDDPRNIFWTPALSFHPYKHGDKKVSFGSLWPKYKELRDLLQNSGVQQTILSTDAVLDVSTLACTCGPAHLLQCLVELELIRIDQVLESGSGLLHLAILAHNIASAQYLMAAKISPKIRDIKGLTADQVCFSPSVRKQMAPRYILSRDVSKDKILLKPSLQDKDMIFKLASNPRHFVDIQKKLQTLDFNVNTECDNSGDFLLHIAVRKGLNQLPLLMALVNIQKADIELCNADGMTPLMLAAAAGNCVLCDVLICLFGADPNKRSPQSGRGALHYAAEGNHRKTVECLIRRGADINMEDHDGLRADDVPACIEAADDCREIIVFNRSKRLEMLSDLVKKGEVVSSQLLPSDLCVVDADGNTLIMIAAIFNRFQTLNCLLDVSKSTINAQHSKTGLTALALAAKLGNLEAVTILLRHKACPTITDMAGYMPLHQAVMNNHEHVVDVFLDYFPDTYVSLYKAMWLCKRTSLHIKLKSAWERRQEEIVTPKLLGCALNGDAEELFLLLDEGDNINPKSGTGNWPLYLAVENGHLEVLKLLFEKGGDIRKRHPTTGATALHVAAKMGHQSIISFLLQYCRDTSKSLQSTIIQNTQSGSSKSGQSPRRRRRLLDINAVDRDNKTALQVAAEKGFSRIVDLLLSHGATTALLDGEGNLVMCPQFEGVRIMIETKRQQHTHQIMRAIEEKSKKASKSMLPTLQQMWLPQFDHNLRNKEGSTPLMVAAGTGKVQVIQYLLESAVYPEVTQYESDSSEGDSDTDSGVLDPVSGTPKDGSKNEDEFQASHEGVSVAYTISTDIPSVRKQDYGDSSVRGHGDDLADSSEFYKRRLTRIVHDANRPKGLSIVHDGQISHVCAMNLLDGTNVLHHSIRNTDTPHILTLFLNLDPSPLNMQDDRGETVLHLACRLRRKKSVELLLARPDLDLNIRTFDGHLPEEVTSSKAIKKMVEKARAASGEKPVQGLQLPQHEVSVYGSEKTVSFSGSTVNFDHVHSRYETLKNDTKAV